MTVELDKERGPQLRVEQGGEPAAFLSLWGGAMVTHSGRRGEQGRNSWRMYIVRGEMEEETCLVEVDCGVASLRSRAAFVLVNVGKNKVMTWAGHLAQPHHREMADKAADRFKSSPPKEMGFGRSISVSKEKTGKEGSGFWEAVKGSGAVYAEMAKKDVAGTTPRLFEMTSVSGQFEVTEITSPFRRVDVLNPLPFEQATLYKAEQPGKIKPRRKIGPNLTLRSQPCSFSTAAPACGCGKAGDPRTTVKGTVRAPRGAAR